MRIEDWCVFAQVAARGDVGFAEAYRDELWSTDDLVSVLQLAYRNEDALGRYLHGRWYARLAARTLYARQPNSRGGSRRNIRRHYDLGAEFFGLWLDPSMTYSSAMFGDADEPLEQAQRRKHDAILERLGGRPARVLDIGCGWGSFVQRAIERADHQVAGITNSREQHRYVTQRVAPYGTQASVSLRDYRDERRRFDHIVSIEMLESVGERYWPSYFAKIAALLEPRGRAVIQTIVVRDEEFVRYRRGSDFFRSLIFPGGMLPSEARIRAEAREAGLKVAERRRFGRDYAQTARCWLSGFEARTEEVNRLGFDAAFVRLWRFYLAACVAVFSTGKLDVMQLELRHV